jgi:hypothetical protein
MEAPEKVWVNKDHAVYFQPPKSGGYIEYISKDAFIEKACDVFCKVCGHYAHSVPTHICRHDCRYFSDFKGYMKRE